MGFPLLAAASLAVSRRAFGAVTLLLTLASGVAAWLLLASGAPIDRIYYGTDTRAAEFGIGALLAIARVHAPNRPLQQSGRWARWGGIAAFSSLLAMWSSVPVTADYLYRGGFAFHALLSAAAIAAALSPTGPARTLLAVRPLRWVGKVSYGAYLYHWPIFLWLNPAVAGTGSADPGQSNWLLFATQVTLTLVVAGVSYRFVENPIRTGRMLPGWQPWLAAPVAGLGVVAIVWTATQALPEEALDFSQPERVSTDSSAASDTLDAGPSRVPRIAVYGDSTALRLGVGLRRWIRGTDQALSANGIVETGCGIDSGGWRAHRGREKKLSQACAERSERWRQSVEDLPLDVAVVLTGRWEITDRKLSGDSQWRSLGDPVFDDYIRTELLRAADILGSSGALVVWLTSPSFENSQRMRVDRDPALDPNRIERLNELIRDLERRRPGVVKVVEFGAFVATLPETIAGAAPRPDGVHLTDAAAFEVSERWLGPMILELFRAHRAN